MEVAAGNDAGVALLVNATPTIANTEFTYSLDKLPCCTVCLAQSHRETKRPLIPLQLGARLIQIRKENFRTLQRRKPQ